MAARIRWMAAVCALSLAAFAAASEYDVKAAFVFNFSKFVEWPEGTFESATTPITLCILGDSPIGDPLVEAVRGKQVNGRDVVVHPVASLAGAAGCNLVFISASEQARLQGIFSELADQPVLTVSDAGAAAEHGAIIGLTLEENRVRFEVNLLAARKSGLRLGSQLLKVATRVIGRP
jgi:hypothetical protein